jgi:protein tyrosine phosphatase (PTP) superfamily phosphohydrolase (DUF442 family)
MRHLVFLFLAVATAACAARTELRSVPEPLVLTTSAYELAGSLPLPQQEPLELPGLHNVFRLSDQIVSGSEPHGEQAFEEMRRLGIRTVLTVDGKVPDAETAARYGLRYVHVPIRYNGITEQERVAIAKTFRELEGPFYVHCYHGQHRGPAAAALGRLVLDQASREQAVAEMRQYCGTSKKYEGLYRDIAAGDLPDAAATAASDFDFAPAFRFEGERGAMVEMARSFDTLKDLAERDWQVNPEHPDATAHGEARRLYQALSQVHDLPATAFKPGDYREILSKSLTQSKELLALLESSGGVSPESSPKAKDLVGSIGKGCEACHGLYRNQ